MSKRIFRVVKLIKRTKDKELENEKARQYSSTTMESTLNESTATSYPEMDNLCIVEEAKQRMADLQITNIDKIISESMAKHVEL